MGILDSPHHDGFGTTRKRKKVGKSYQTRRDHIDTEIVRNFYGESTLHVGDSSVLGPCVAGFVLRATDSRDFDGDGSTLGPFVAGLICRDLDEDGSILGPFIAGLMLRAIVCRDENVTGEQKMQKVNKAEEKQTQEVE